MLESYVRDRLRKKDILLMTHIVLGYPSFDACREIIASMVEAGADLMELQVPFSDPIADGPVILQTNQKALNNQATVTECIDFSCDMARDFDIPFLLMTYYNIPFKYGLNRFISAMAEGGLKGAIIPDLPPEEGLEFLNAMKNQEMAPVLTFSPTTPFERMEYLASLGKGFIYCIARKGVTGAQTDFSLELESYLSRCRKSTGLPLALGFGVKEKKDIEFLKGKVDIAVVGTQTIRVIEKEGIGSVGAFIRGLG